MIDVQYSNLLSNNNNYKIQSLVYNVVQKYEVNTYVNINWQRCMKFSKINRTKLHLPFDHKIEVILCRRVQ